MDIFRTLCINILLAFMLNGPVYSQATTETAADTTYTNRLTVLPVLGSSPETNLMFGGVAMQQFKPAGAGAETRPSYVILSAIYTLNNQVLVELTPALILPEESWIFGGLGEVWPSIDELSLNNLKWAGGGGLRFDLNPGDPTNIRLDFAVGKNTSGLYLTLGEAF